MINRKYRRAATMALALLLPALAQAATPAQKLADTSDAPELLVIAHRGCWDVAPEMSLAGIRACEGTGIDGVEIDVRKTRDGALVLIHDDSVDRTTNGIGKVAEMTLEEIRGLRLRRGAGGRNVVVTDERVPTLEEGLLAARDKFIVHLDLKTATHADVAPVLEKLGMEMQATAWIRGLPADAEATTDPSLGQVIAIVPIIEECGPGSAAACKPVPLSALEDFAGFTPRGYFFNANASMDFIRKANAVPRVAGTRITAESLWKIDNEITVDRHAKWRQMIDAGVSMILTDHPRDLVALLDREYPDRRGRLARRGPQVAAHRGGAMHRPENTLPAFRHAVELGAEVLEFDMVMTADDRLVVHHDATINPALCTPDAGAGVVAGPVRGLTLAQARQFDCGTRVRDIYAVPGHVPAPGARIPTVDEVVGEFARTGVDFYAETKVPRPAAGIADVDPRAFAEQIDALVRRHGVEDRFVLQSADYRTIDALHAINPRIRTCLLGAHNWGHRDFLQTLRQHHASCILLREAIASQADVRQLQQAGIQVYSEVIDTPEDWARYVELGVDVIFTNHPEGTIDFLRRKGLRD